MNEPTSSIESLRWTLIKHRDHAQSLSRITIINSDAEQDLNRALTHVQHRLDVRDTSPTLASFAKRRVRQAEKSLRKRVRAALAFTAARTTLRCTRLG